MKRQLETTGDGTLGNTNSSVPPAKKRINQLKNICFTFNNYGGVEMLETLETTFRPLALRYTFQEETGESGTPHIQGMVVLKKRMRWNEFNLPNSIHWEAMRGTEQQARDYCRKLETRTGQVREWGWPRELKLITELRPFQKSLLDMCLEEPNDRDIVWIWDQTGKMGKTQFVKLMIAKYGALAATGGRCEDLACILAMAHKEGKDLNSPFTFLLNLPRETDPDKVSYKFLESIKDGLVTSPKYESSTMVFNSPHVVVLANCRPVVTRMTSDRWKVFTIDMFHQLVEVRGY